MKVAILGSTSHIAKNLIYFFSKDPKYELFLFARNIGVVKEFLRTIGGISSSIILEFDSFFAVNYDVVINCIGIADPNKQKILGIELFNITEHYDNLILNYLLSHEHTLYINFSSGAVYGTELDISVNEDSNAIIAVNNIMHSDYYRIAKINSEAKHRSMADKKIIDLRVFSFFSRHINLESGFLLCEMTRCANEHRIFYTSDIDIERDYIAPSDLFAIVELCIMECNYNIAFDVYSAKPVRKSEIVALFEREFCLETQIDKKNRISATGSKQVYFSSNKTLGRKIGYIPKVTAIASIKYEVCSILNVDEKL